eukprot:4732217-Prymnesium_polylepis.1
MARASPHPSHGPPIPNMAGGEHLRQVDRGGDGRLCRLPPRRRHPRAGAPRRARPLQSWPLHPAPP